MRNKRERNLDLGRTHTLVYIDQLIKSSNYLLAPEDSLFMTNRSSRHMTAVLVVAVLLAVFAMACVTREMSALSEASDEIRATVNDSDQPTPTRVTEDDPIESSLVSPITATFFPRKTSDRVFSRSEFTGRFRTMV